MHGLRLKKLSVALGVLLLPMSVFAAGLGQLNVDSGIGEPLRANIELLEVSAADLSSITAVIAPEATYAKQGIERPASHSNIKIDIAKNKKGRPVLELKSRQPMDEPFLDMLIQLDWSTGRLLREYTVLLDPPGYDSTVQPVQAPVVKSKPAVKTKAASITKKNTASTVAAPSTDEYLTQKGDTLSKIARRMKPESVSLDQMLVALYQENKSAFSGNNINRLNVGKVIRPPSQETLNAISRREASKEVKVQTKNWNAYRNKLAGIVADDVPTANLGDEENTQSSGGAIKPATEDKSMPADEGPKDVVKLSTAETGNSAEAKSLQEKVAALQEEVVAREKGLQEAQERTTALEKQIEDMQKLLALKSDVMANAQEAAASGDPAVNVQDGNESVKSATDEAQPAEENSAEAKLTSKQKPAVKSKPTIATTPVEKPGFITGLINGLDKRLLAAGAGLVALFLTALVLLRNRRKKNLDDFEQGIMTSGGLKANTVFGNTSGASVDTGDTSFLTDFSQSANGSMIDTHDVDPIAEAEVYMAYGRDAQAEEILKDAITKEPKRYELHLKLLEMYAASKNMSAFETVSGELYTTLGAEDPTWAKVAEIGIKLEPSNPLYQVSNTGEPKAAEDTEKLDAADFSESPLAAEEDLDFSFDGNASKDEEVPSSTAQDDGLVADFETSTKDDSSAVPEVTAGSDEVAADLSSGESPSQETAAEAKEQSSEAGNLDFDLGSLNVSEETISAVTQENVADVESANFEQTMPDLTFPETETKADVEPNAASIIADTIPAEGVASENTLELPDINDAAETVSDDSASVDVDLTAASDIASNNDFDFGLDTTKPDVEAFNANSAEESNTLDLSGISLDVDEAASDESAATNLEPEAVADSESDTAPPIEESQAPEPEDVDTKLDLIAAYLEMEDKVGAKELLDEVMKEGGPNQRKKAETLLSQIT